MEPHSFGILAEQIRSVVAVGVTEIQRSIGVRAPRQLVLIQRASMPVVSRSAIHFCPVTRS